MVCIGRFLLKNKHASATGQIRSVFEPCRPHKLGFWCQTALKIDVVAVAAATWKSHLATCFGVIMPFSAIPGAQDMQWVPLAQFAYSGPSILCYTVRAVPGRAENDPCWAHAAPRNRGILSAKIATAA